MSHGDTGGGGGMGGILIVAPRGCRFSAKGATSIDLHIAEIVRASFRPEFLNRLDEILLFQRLQADQIGAIVDI